MGKSKTIRKNKTTRKSRVRNIWEKIQELCFPQVCILCREILWSHEENAGICDSCKTKLRLVGDSCCNVCGKPVEKKRMLCKDCNNRSHFYKQGKAIFLYQGEIKGAMYRLKYGNERYIAKVIARYGGERYQHWIRQNQISLLVPVPMYRDKERKRGYNQAELIAKELGQYWNIPVETTGIKRIRDTKAQKGLGNLGRKYNLKNAFHMSRNVVKSRYILLVDDIYTTGSTVDAVAKICKDAGAKEVYVLCACIGAKD